MERVDATQVALSESELPRAVGCSKRAARRIAMAIGRKVGGRRLILLDDLVRWLRDQPVAGEPPPPPPQGTHEFRIR